MFRYAILLVLSIPFLVSADAYYVDDYAPQYTPYNLEAAIDSKYTPCSKSIKLFDEYYTTLQETYGAPITIGENVSVDYSVLKGIFENEFRDCLAAHRTEEEEDAKREADERYRIKHEAEILTALEECDFEYFDEVMSMEEKMQTFDERKVCEEKSSAPIVDIKEIVPVTISTPVTTREAPVPVVSVPNSNSFTDADVTRKEIDTVATTTSTEPEILELTQDDVDRIVQEKVEQALADAQSQTEEKKPSFIKRFFSFFSKWF